MRITEVQALVKYSAEVKGSWVAVELGGTASLTNNEETLESVSDELYKRLTKQLKVLWASNKAGGGETKTETQEQPSIAPDHSPGLATTQQHYCVEHNQEYKKRNGQYGEFWSHQIKGTRQWCNEK